MSEAERIQFTDFTNEELAGLFERPPVLEGRLQGQEINKLKCDALVDDGSRYMEFARQAARPRAEADIRRRLEQRRNAEKAVWADGIGRGVLNLLGL